MTAAFSLPEQSVYASKETALQLLIIQKQLRKNIPELFNFLSIFFSAYHPIKSEMSFAFV